MESHTPTTESQPSMPRLKPIFAYGILLLLAASIVAGFWPFIQNMVYRWDNEDSNYCFLVVPLFLYLCWEKHLQFKFSEFRASYKGLALFAAALGLILVGELGSAETLMYIGLWCLVVAGMVLLYGATRLRNLWFELLILAFMVPMPPFIIQTFTANLKRLATSFAVNLLRLFDISVLQDGNIIDIGVQQLQVIDACSGLRYVVPMFLFALLLGHLYGKSRAPRLLLLLFVLPVAILINGLRIFVTAVLYVKGYPELAENFFHDFAGLALFLIAGVGLLGILLLLNRWWSKPVRHQSWQDQGGDGRSKQALIVAALYCALLFGGGYALHHVQAGQVIPERQTFEHFPLQIDGWQGRREYIAQEILDQLWADDYVNIVFTRPDRPGQQIYLLVPYYSYQKTRHTAHAPQSCLLGGGWHLAGTEDRQIQVNEAKNITLRTMLMQKGNSHMVAGYFFLGRGRDVVSPWMNKVYLLVDALGKRRTDGALVRVEMVMTDSNLSPAEHKDMENFIIQLWKILPGYVPM